MTSSISKSSGGPFLLELLKEEKNSVKIFQMIYKYLLSGKITYTAEDAQSEKVNRKIKTLCNPFFGRGLKPGKGQELKLTNQVSSHLQDISSFLICPDVVETTTGSEFELSKVVLYDWANDATTTTSKIITFYGKTFSNFSHTVVQFCFVILVYYLLDIFYGDANEKH